MYLVTHVEHRLFSDFTMLFNRYITLGVVLFAGYVFGTPEPYVFRSEIMDALLTVCRFDTDGGHVSELSRRTSSDTEAGIYARYPKTPTKGGRRTNRRPPASKKAKSPS